MKIKEKIVELILYFLKMLNKMKNLIEFLLLKLKISKNFKNKNWLKNIFIFFGIPFILSIIIINSFKGHFDLITIDSIFVAIAIFTPIMFSFLLSIFSIDKELLINEKDYKIVKKFTNDVSFILIVCMITIFLILIKASLYARMGIFDSILDFFILWGLLIIGFNLLKILNNLNFIANERLKELRQNPKTK